MENDLRARATRNIIRQSYLELLQDSKKITVTEICKKAGISRTTFYNHYEYIEDITDEITREYTDNLRKLIIRSEHDARRIIKKILTDLKNSDAYQLEFAVDKSSIIDQKISMMVDDLLSEQFHKMYISDDENMLRMISAYIGSGINAVISFWIDSGFHNSVDEVTDLLVSLLPGIIYKK